MSQLQLGFERGMFTSKMEGEEAKEFRLEMLLAAHIAEIYRQKGVLDINTSYVFNSKASNAMIDLVEKIKGGRM